MVYGHRILVFVVISLFGRGGKNWKRGKELEITIVDFYVEYPAVEFCRTHRISHDPSATLSFWLFLALFFLLWWCVCGKPITTMENYTNQIQISFERGSRMKKVRANYIPLIAPPSTLFYMRHKHQGSDYSFVVMCVRRVWKWSEKITRWFFCFFVDLTWRTLLFPEQDVMIGDITVALEYTKPRHMNPCVVCACGTTSPYRTTLPHRLVFW